jgi:UDP-N-acetylglucosamine 2-epimerase (non-hydrolysing)
MTRVVCVAGARPNYIKIKPVIDALEARDADVILVHTGQHYDPLMNDVFFDELGIRDPDHYLAVGSGTHAQQMSRTMVAFEPLVEQLQPDVVVVVGDVNGTLACALVAAKAGPLVAHVEAGLRSRDWTMPEEINRVATDRVSDYLLAPSSDAVENLRSEGYREDQIHLVGNVMVDTLLANIERARERDTLSRYGVQEKGYVLVTLHRPSNVDDAENLAGLLAMLGSVAERCPVVFPVHPRTRAKITHVPPGLILTEPAGYLDFIALQASARLVVTDSGGVQEETSVLGISCLTLRDNTERPITVSEGTNRVVGRDPTRVLAAVLESLSSPTPARRPLFWDGKAGERIADVLLEGSSRPRRRPTDLETCA